MDDKTKHMAVCMSSICDPEWARNPVAWFDLHMEGITRELMQEMVASGQWYGPPPIFDAAPAYDDPMWRLMLERRGHDA